MRTESLATRIREETHEGSLYLVGLLCATFSGFLAGVFLTLIYLGLFY